MTATPTATSSVHPDVARKLYQTMILAAATEERLLQGMANGEFATVIWPARGQEAIAAGFGAALRPMDRLVTNYRCIHDLIGKGVPPREVLGEILGRTVGASGGKGGTMHITAPDKGVMLTTGIVGAGVPVAVGLALAARQEGSDRVVAVTFGDGATNTGSFHEGLNLASTWQLPVIFICQNNRFAEMTPIEATMNIEHIAERALAFSMPGVTVDGNDPEAVYAAVREAAERGRGGGGPTLIECETFRFKGHFFGDQQKYMPPEELAAAHERDPIVRYRAKLLVDGVFENAAITAIEEEAAREVADAMAEVLASPVPDAAALERDFFAEMKGIPA
jgi:TPP-dependent pyruvate/acetoin dehydrogenase alpha subunit